MPRHEPFIDTIHDLARRAYAEVNEKLELPKKYDQSRDGNSDLLTYAALQAAQDEGILLRRELHRDDEGNWHYILAQGPPDARPMPYEPVTDLNPWQGKLSRRGKGLLHLTRYGLMYTLRENGASLEYADLRSTGTIVLPHDDQPRYDENRGVRL